MDHVGDDTKPTEEVQAVNSGTQEIKNQGLKNKDQVRNFLFFALKQNRPEIASFLFEKFSQFMDEIFNDEDGKLHDALIDASSAGNTEVVKLILNHGEGRIKDESYDAVLESTTFGSGVKKIVIEKTNINDTKFEKLMFASIEKGELDLVKALFDKKK